MWNCSENGGGNDGAVGAGAPKWNQPLKDPGEECPRQRERQEQRAPHPGGCACRVPAAHMERELRQRQEPAGVRLR